MKIIRHAETITAVGYQRVFEYAGSGSGFGFDCDEKGNVQDLNPVAEANYHECLTGQVDGKPIEDKGILQHKTRWREPAVGLCDCGHEVPLDGFTNTCEGCGADYNHGGQRLAPREQWGEETGETAADILGPDPAEAFPDQYCDFYGCDPALWEE